LKKDIILFDLDGTLLPMDQDIFTKAYFKELLKKICPFGYESQKVIDGVWAGTLAMIRNNGVSTNENLFWEKFSSLLGERVLDLKDEFTQFYKNEFNNVKVTTDENRFAPEALREAHRKANKVVLATNPIFPLCAVESRLSWLGLQASEFDFITSYENSSYCKPNPDYYREILKRYDAKPEDCLMIGNDVEEDGEASAQVGIDAFIVLDNMISKGKELDGMKNGTFQEMIEYLIKL
jgi:FMN phosphatase YigB (HAD superfamily)